MIVQCMRIYAVIKFAICLAVSLGHIPGDLDLTQQLRSLQCQAKERSVQEVNVWQLTKGRLIGLKTWRQVRSRYTLLLMSQRENRWPSNERPLAELEVALLRSAYAKVVVNKQNERKR